MTMIDMFAPPAPPPPPCEVCGAPTRIVVTVHDGSKHSLCVECV